MQNLVRRGFLRDSAVLSTLEQWGVMSASQIQTLHFTGFKSHDVAKRKTEDRLQKLATRGKLIRWRGEKEYRYSVEERPAQAEHKILVNWVRIWLVRQLKSWERLHCFAYEQDYGVLRCDAFAAVKNAVTKQFNRLYFVELDRTSSNKWDKVQKYNKLFEQINSGKFTPWWISLTEKFPTVLCVTADRKEKILRHVQEENKNGLLFEVKLLDEVTHSHHLR